MCDKKSPLTIEQLIKMEGMPVWMEDEKVWGIVHTDDYGQWKDKPFIHFFWRGISFDWDIKKRGLKCYAMEDVFND